MKKLCFVLLLALLVMPFAAAYGVTFYSPRMNPQYGKIFELVEPDKQYVVEDTKDRDIAIRKVTFTIDREAKTAGITIYHLLFPPDDLPSVPANDSYEVNEIKYSGFVPHDTKELVYEFRVAKQWLENNSVARNHVMLHAYNSRTDFWEEVPTAITGDDDEYVYFSADGVGYHYILIGKSQSGSEAAAKEIKTEVEKVEETKAETAEKTETTDEQKKLLESGTVEQVKLDTAPQPAAQPTALPAAAPASTGPEKPVTEPDEGGSLLIGLLVVLALIAAGVIIYIVASKRTLTSSVDKELHNYISESMKRGKSKEEVRQRLLDVGWHQDRVEKALAKHNDVEAHAQFSEHIMTGSRPATERKPAPQKPAKAKKKAKRR